jgi:hypothetical protein
MHVQFPVASTRVPTLFLCELLDLFFTVLGLNFLYGIVVAGSLIYVNYMLKGTFSAAL